MARTSRVVQYVKSVEQCEKYIKLGWEVVSSVPAAQPADITFIVGWFHEIPIVYPEGIRPGPLGPISPSSPRG